MSMTTLIKTRHNTGLSAVEIAEQLGVPVQDVIEELETWDTTTEDDPPADVTADDAGGRGRLGALAAERTSGEPVVIEPAWENFTLDEFMCTCGCGENKMVHSVITDLQELRTYCGFPFRITSGYRCANHPEEFEKGYPGAHVLGVAADISVWGVDAYSVLQAAFISRKWPGVGVNQQGDDRYVHLDQAPDRSIAMRPGVWSYNA